MVAFFCFLVLYMGLMYVLQCVRGMHMGMDYGTLKLETTNLIYSCL